MERISNRQFLRTSCTGDVDLNTVDSSTPLNPKKDHQTHFEYVSSDAWELIKQILENNIPGTTFDVEIPRVTMKTKTGEACFHQPFKVTLMLCYIRRKS